MRQRSLERAALDGVELDYEVRGVGEPVVLVHAGACGDWFSGLMEEPALAGRHRLVRYHRVGYGGSSHLPGPVSLADQAGHCRSLLRHLGIERAHVVGHSSSANIALQLALDAPGVVGSLALLEPALLAVPTGPYGPAALERYRAGDKAGAVDTWMRGVCGPDWRAAFEEVLPGAAEQAVADADTFFAQELPAVRGWSFGQEDARRVTQPALAVLGARSREVTPVFDQRHELLLAWLPNVEPFVLPDATHLLHVQNPRGMARGPGRVLRPPPALARRQPSGRRRIRRCELHGGRGGRPRRGARGQGWPRRPDRGRQRGAGGAGRRLVRGQPAPGHGAAGAWVAAGDAVDRAGVAGAAAGRRGARPAAPGQALLEPDQPVQPDRGRRRRRARAPRPHRPATAGRAGGHPGRLAGAVLGHHGHPAVGAAAYPHGRPRPRRVAAAGPGRHHGHAGRIAVHLVLRAQPAAAQRGRRRILGEPDHRRARAGRGGGGVQGRARRRRPSRPGRAPRPRPRAGRRWAQLVPHAADRRPAAAGRLPARRARDRRGGRARRRAAAPRRDRRRARRALAARGAAALQPAAVRGRRRHRRAAAAGHREASRRARAGGGGGGGQRGGPHRPGGGAAAGRLRRQRPAAAPAAPARAGPSLPGLPRRPHPAGQPPALRRARPGRPGGGPPRPRAGGAADRPGRLQDRQRHAGPRRRRRPAGGRRRAPAPLRPSRRHRRPPRRRRVRRAAGGRRARRRGRGRRADPRQPRPAGPRPRPQAADPGQHRRGPTARSGEDAGELLRNADVAMYAAKERGKGGYVCYAAGMDAGILKQAQLGAELRQALDSDQLHLVYQPIVRLPDGRIVGAEALLRWRHPTRGPVPPAEFIPTAERTGLIVPLGREVLREACRQAAVWRRAHGDAAPATISVNVAARQLQEPGFVGEVADALREAGLAPQRLVVEATETAVLKGGQVLATLHALHDLGVRLALDDFGTGQSSLGLLRTCPVDILKLDKSFVDGVTGAEQQAAVAAAIARMAQALGLDAVAEGIETGAQAERLCELGYRLGQGFNFARPLPADELGRLLAAPAAPASASAMTAGGA